MEAARKTGVYNGVNEDLSTELTLLSGNKVHFLEVH